MQGQTPMRAELDRIRAEYGRRDADPLLVDRYSLFDAANLFMIQGRERAIIAALKAEGMTSLCGLRILDVGCGSGAETRSLLAYGASPRLLHGVDMLAERIAVARHLAPHLHYIRGDAGHLPYATAAFDVVMQFTMFSSILDSELRRQTAYEMLRVLKPGGLILWYDFWLNPTNRATRGVQPTEIKLLFPNCRYRFHRMTLAPPIARRVVPHSWLTAQLLECLPFLRTHYLAVIRKLER